MGEYQNFTRRFPCHKIRVTAPPTTTRSGRSGSRSELRLVDKVSCLCARYQRQKISPENIPYFHDYDRILKRIWALGINELIELVFVWFRMNMTMFGWHNLSNCYYSCSSSYYTGINGRESK